MMDYARINQGRTAEVFDLGNGRIMKLFYKSFPAQAVENESNIANLIKDYNLPIPGFYGKVEQEGRTGLVYNPCLGTTGGSSPAN
jgi:hypothetical protein